MLLADEIKARGVELDTERVLRMALIHDWAETRVGDMPKTATSYFGAEARKHAELNAFMDIVKGAGEAGSKYGPLYRDYEQRDSNEARVVKAADVIDLLIEAYALERAGSRGLDEFWEVAESATFQLPSAAEDVIRSLIDSIVEARAELR